MRIWSIHPSYLDAKGLVALWRETLLAKHVLLGKTKGYRHHPQLIRFKQQDEPVMLIDFYLSEVYKESLKRGYRFNAEKFDDEFAKVCNIKIPVTTGQIAYEKQHLLQKLKQRDEERYQLFQQEHDWKIHPLFERITGDIEDWEII